MKNALTIQVGMLGDMFSWLVANLKQWPIGNYLVKQACGNDKRACVYIYRFEIFLTADDAKTGFAAPSPPLLCAVSFWFDSFWRSPNLQGH